MGSVFQKLCAVVKTDCCDNCMDDNIIVINEYCTCHLADEYQLSPAKFNSDENI